MTDKKKEANQEKPHNLVIFKSKEVQKKIDKFTFETIDQEDKIKLLCDFKPYGGHYIYSIQLHNESLAPISEVIIKISYPKFLTISRSYPPTLYIPRAVEEEYISKVNLEFDELNESSSREIHLHFTPLSLGNEGKLKTTVIYVNSKDYVRVIDSEPVELILDKIIINPKIIPSSYIREFSQIPRMKRAIVSIGIGIQENFDPSLYFNVLEQTFLRKNLQLLARDPNQKILWYFGSELESREDLLVIGQIISNKVEIIATSKNHQVLISSLTLLTNEFKENILTRNIASSSDQFYDLECKYCGAILPYFPNKGKEIKCNKCKYEQKVW